LDPSLIPASLDVKIRNDFFRLRFEVEGFQPPMTHEDSLSEDMRKDDDMDHDGPSNNSGDETTDREVKRKKNEDVGNDNDNGPSPQAPSNGNSLALSPIISGSTKRIFSHDIVHADVDDSHRYANVISSPNSNFVLSTPKCLDPLFSVVFYSDDVEGKWSPQTLLRLSMMCMVLSDLLASKPCAR
jgi:hypothetical protein